MQSSSIVKMERRKDFVGERQQQRRIRRQLEEWDIPENLSSSSEDGSPYCPHGEQQFPETGNTI